MQATPLQCKRLKANPDETQLRKCTWEENGYLQESMEIILHDQTGTV